MANLPVFIPGTTGLAPAPSYLSPQTAANAKIASDGRKAVILSMTRKISSSTQYHLDAILECEPRTTSTIVVEFPSGASSTVVAILPNITGLLDRVDASISTRFSLLPETRDNELKPKMRVIAEKEENDETFQANSNAVTTFTCFPNLPQEIQDRIWVTFDEPRKVSTCLGQTPNSAQEVTFRGGFPLVCRINKAVTIEAFSPHLGYVRMKRLPKDFSGVFFRPAIDMLVLNHLALSPSLNSDSPAHTSCQYEFKLMQKSFGKVNLFNKLKCVAVYISRGGVNPDTISKLLGHFAKYRALELILIIAEKQRHHLSNLPRGMRRPSVNEKKLQFMDTERKGLFNILGTVESLLEDYAKQGETVPLVKFVRMAK